jgi:hypothetical protein
VGRTLKSGVLGDRVVLVSFIYFSMFSRFHLISGFQEVV